MYLDLDPASLSKILELAESSLATSPDPERLKEVISHLKSTIEFEPTYYVHG